MNSTNNAFPARRFPLHPESTIASPRKSRWIAVVATALFASFAPSSPAALLLYEHSLVKADDFTKLDAAFFTMNGVISIVFFACVLAERLLRWRGTP